MEKRQINPWSWQDRFGFSQGWRVDDAEAVVFVAGQGAVSADGEPYSNSGVHVFEFDGTPTVKRGRMYVDFEPLMRHIATFEEARAEPTAS